MVTAICEITAVFTHKNYPSYMHTVTVACPVYDNRQIRVFRDNYWQLVPFVDGISDKVSTILSGWVFNWDIRIETRTLEYPGIVTCGDSANEIVRDIVKTLLNSLLWEKKSK